MGTRAGIYTKPVTVTQHADLQERSRWLKAVDRVGYAATAVLGIEIVALVMMMGPQLLESERRWANFAAEQGTKPTPLLPNDDGYVRAGALALLGSMMPLNKLDGNGLHFVAMPSFGIAEYGVVIYAPKTGAGEARGTLTVFRRDQKLPRTRTFLVPAEAYRTWAASFDQHTDGWTGEYSACFDGTPTAFERVRGTRVTSGIGNCEDHYDEVKNMLLGLVRRYAPGDDLPNSEGWHPHEELKIVREWL